MESKSLSKYPKDAWVHFVAVGGTGMGSLALMLKNLGFRVTGSDGPLYPPMSTLIDGAKIPRKEAYDAKNLEGATWGFKENNPHLVIVGNAVSRPNVEAQATEKLLEEKKTQRMSFAQALAEFAIAQRKSFVICGTHGKTTTTSIASWALESLGLSPGFFIGGVPANFGQGCRQGDGNCFVSEGDEYDTAYWDKESKFLHYRPTWVLCTGIEYDHADIYANVEQIVKSFEKLVPLTKGGWVLIDDESAPLKDPVKKVAQTVLAKKLPLFRYGSSSSSPYQLLSYEASLLPWDKVRMGMRLKIKTPKFGEIEIFTPQSGHHNALNTVGVVAMFMESGEFTKPNQVQDFLKTFKGVKRRQEEVFKSDKLIVIDDFAHHPTAIKETIAGIKKNYPSHKVAAFFEARSATSSRNIFLKEFSECFDDADAIFLSPPTKTNIPQNEKLDVNELTRLIKERVGSKPFVMEIKAEDLSQKFMDWTKTLSQEKFVALVMSNGPFQGIHKMLADLKC